MDVTQPVWGECPGPVLEKGVVEKKKKKKGESRGDLDPFRDNFAA
jgi:hypothetical protein